MTPSSDVVLAAQAAQKEYKIPASVSIAQYGLESGWGKHIPPGSNNPFGIKAVPGQASVLVDTHEFIHGRYIPVKAPFRAFQSLSEAFLAHGALLTHSQYSKAFLELPSVSEFVSEMAKVYATDPNYAKELMEIITGDNLEKYD